MAELYATYDDSEVWDYGFMLVNRKKNCRDCSGISFVLQQDIPEYKKMVKNQMEHIRRSNESMKIGGQEIKPDSKLDVKAYIENNVIPWLKMQTISMSKEEKILFMRKVFNVENFSDLENLPIKKMRDAINEKY